MTERRQEAARPTLFSGQPQEDIPLPCLAPTVATAIQPDWVSLSGLSLSRQSDALGNGKLVYAIYHATQSQSAHLPSRASHNRKTNWRLVENVSDEMLLKHIADGDKAAMHILFARHRTRVFRFIQHMIRNPAIADDLVSQVFLDVWRSANKFENRAKVSTWLLSIARFKATSSLRARTTTTSIRMMRLELPMPETRRKQRLIARKRVAFCVDYRKTVSRSSRNHRSGLLPREVGRRSE